MLTKTVPEKVISLYGRVDILLNNAALSGPVRKYDGIRLPIHPGLPRCSAHK
jgi:hypothetical protein